MANNDQSTANTSSSALTTALVIGAVLLIGLLIWRSVSSSNDSDKKSDSGVNLTQLMTDAKSKLASDYKSQTLKDNTDTSDAWSVAGIAPGYDFSTSSDLNKYHLSLQSSGTESTVPTDARQALVTMLKDKGGKEIDSPVPTTYPTKKDFNSYYTFDNAACYLSYEDDKTSLGLDCAYNSDFAAVAKAVKPMVDLYRQATKATDKGDDYAVHMPYSGTTADKGFEYAAVPMDGTVGYFYKKGDSSWNLYKASATGIPCAELTGDPKVALATVCKA